MPVLSEAVHMSFYQNKIDTLYRRYVYVPALFTKSLKHFPNAADHAEKPWQLIKEREEL
jgi:hypothetical protein